MAGLTALAPELLDMIIGYLHPRHITSSLYNLCLTAKALRCIAQPRLFRIVAPKSIPSFLQIVLENPNLAEHIQSLNLFECCEEEFCTAEGRCWRDRRELLSQRRHASLKMTELLVMKLPGLEEIALPSWLIDYGLLSSFLSKDTSGPTRNNRDILPALQAVAYSCSTLHSNEACDATDILPLLGIRRIEKFCITQCMHINMAGFDRLYLKEVEFIACAFTAPQLQPFIAACPDLVSFKYEAGSCLVKDYGGHEVKALELGQALIPVKDTLRCLHINLQYRGGDGFGTVRENTDVDEEAIDSLTVFSKLESLAICQYDLAAEEDIERWEDSDGLVIWEKQSKPWIHKLPKSLKKLTITDTYPSLYHELEKLLDIVSVSLPELKLVQIYDIDGTNLKPLFEQAGIEFILTTRSRWKMYGDDSDSD